MKLIKTCVIALILFPLLIQAQEVENITVLFDSLKTHPKTIADDLVMEKALLGEKMAEGNLYPKIDLFGTYDYSTNPIGLLPIPPNELLGMVKTPGVSQPFSKNIWRTGASVSMPVYVKSIYTMAEKAKIMYHSAESRKYINLLKNEAVIVSLNANLKYLNSMIAALNKKKQSLVKTKEIIIIKVNNQRAPGSALLKINNAFNQVDLAIAGIELKKAELSAQLQDLTGIYLDTSIVMTQIGTYTGSGLVALEPLRYKIDAERLGAKAEKEKLYPYLVAHGNYNHSMAAAYNNGGHINKDYATVGLVLKVPIFDKIQCIKISQSNLAVRELENEFAQKELELSTQAKQLQINLQIIENTLSIYKQSIKDKEKLLEVAKTSYNSSRMSIEDYLKYEDDYVLEQANYNKATAEKWQTLMKLAVIYGNDIEKIVK